ncbi:MAG: DUF5050 domain-containing protein [Clostridiales Family XIII bacterium]|nr:DUF5050 domain-containing protein [Clostridiales Family XIII bacterium]
MKCIGITVCMRRAIVLSATIGFCLILAAGCNAHPSSENAAEEALAPKTEIPDAMSDTGETGIETPGDSFKNGDSAVGIAKPNAHGDVGWAVYNDGYTYFTQDGQMTPPYRSMLLRISDAQDAETEMLFGSTARMDYMAVFDGRVYFVREHLSRYELSRIGECPKQWEVLRTFSENTLLWHADEKWLYYETDGKLHRRDAAGNEEAVQSPGKFLGMRGTDVYYTELTGSNEELLEDYYGGLYRFGFEKALSEGSRESEVVDADYSEVKESEMRFSGTTLIAGDSVFFPAEPGEWKGYADLEKLNLETGESSLVRINAEWAVNYTIFDGGIYYFRGEKDLYRTEIADGSTELLFAQGEESPSDLIYFAPKVLGDWLYYQSYSLDTWFSVHRVRLDGTAAPEMISAGCG